MVRNCLCGFPVGRRTSWTAEKLGRKFISCKFFDHDTGHRGCSTSEWIDQGLIEWQRDVTNVLIAEKQQNATEKQILQSRLIYETYEKERLADELQKLKEKDMKKKGLGEKKVVTVRNEKVGNSVIVCAIVSVLISFAVIKLFC